MTAIDHPGQSNELSEIRRDIRQLQTQSGPTGGDSTHPGSGDASLQLGPDANASGDSSVAAGDSAWATGDRSIAAGYNTLASGADSAAVGSSASAEYDNSGAFGKNAMATATWQIAIGSVSHTVVVPGTFSNPSARRLKQNITPAPDAPGIFPELVEYEKRAAPGPRHLGYIADDLVGTDAERFVTFDDDGAPNGIDYLGLLVAQVARLSARIAELERK